MTDNKSSKFTNPHDRFNYVNDRFNQQKHPRLNPVRVARQHGKDTDENQNEIQPKTETATSEQYSGLIAKLEESRLKELGLSGANLMDVEEEDSEDDLEEYSASEATSLELDDSNELGGGLGLIEMILAMGIIAACCIAVFIIYPKAKEQALANQAKTKSHLMATKQGEQTATGVSGLAYNIVFCTRYAVGCPAEAPNKTITKSFIMTYQAMPVNDCLAWLKQVNKETNGGAFWINQQGQKIRFTAKECITKTPMQVKFN